MQRIRSTVDEKEQSQLLMDLQVVMKSNDCPFIVKFYGALFKEVCFCNNLIKPFYKITFSNAGRLLDMHGADVNILGQILQINSFNTFAEYTRRYNGQDHCCSWCLYFSQRYIPKFKTCLF